MRWLTRTLHRSRILSCLGVGFERQRPLPELLNRLAACYPARYLRRTLGWSATMSERVDRVWIACSGMVW